VYLLYVNIIQIDPVLFSKNSIISMPHAKRNRERMEEAATHNLERRIKEEKLT